MKLLTKGLLKEAEAEKHGATITNLGWSQDKNEKIMSTNDLFYKFADGDNDNGWYIYQKSYMKAFKKRNKEIIRFLKYHTGIPISTEMIEKLQRKLK